MPQDQQSGAAAREWGLKTGKAVAERLGAEQVRPGANEYRLGGELVVIKCAAPRTPGVGVTYAMLERVAKVIGAFEQEDGSFELLALTASEFLSHARDSRSADAAGRVGQVGRLVFEQSGRRLGRVSLAP
jgi:hypothetical protein